MHFHIKVVIQAIECEIKINLATVHHILIIFPRNCKFAISLKLLPILNIG